MKTIKEKNERAKGLVDYMDSPSLVRDLMHALDGELDWRMKSLVYYHLCAFVEENPVIGFRYACKEIYGDTILVKGLVPHHDDALQSRYPGWEFYRADRSLTDDMTAIFGKEFCHVFRAEVAHLDPEDDKLHRIFMTNG